MAERKKKKNTGFAFACWLLIALILIVFFFVKKDTILTNLQSTDFFARVFGKTPEFVQNHEQSKKDNSNAETMQIDIVPEGETEEQTVIDLKTGKAPTAKETPQEVATLIPAEKQEQVKKEEANTTKTQSDNNQSANITQKKDEQTPPAIPTINTPICFVVISPDGSVSRQIVTRKMAKTESPLTDSINLLLAGPTNAEKATTLIPQGSRLLSASVKNGVATLNFNEAFMFNNVGVQGAIAQLMQVVYTATSFSSVNSVQIMIEGHREEYLGTEGTYIGAPLTRSSFN